MKCVKCGKHEAVERGLCEVCLWDSLHIEVPGSIIKKTCSKCGAYFVGKAWVYRDGEEKWERKIFDNFSVNEPFKISGGKLNGTNRLGNYIKLEVEIERTDDDRKVENFEIPFIKESISCPTCNKVTGSYYEAKVQIRGMTGKYTDEMGRIGDHLVRNVENNHTTDPESFISKIEYVKDGIDVYLGKRKDGDSFAKEMKTREITDIIVSKTLAGVRDGKQFFRFTYMVRIMDIEPGSIIYLNGKRYLYQGKSAFGIYLNDLETGREIQVNKRSISFDKLQITGEMASRRSFVVISNGNNECNLMDKQNFSQITISGECKDSEINLYVVDDEYFRIRGE